MDGSFMAQFAYFADRVASPPERGYFRYELPSAADPSVNQNSYVSIGEYK